MSGKTAIVDSQFLLEPYLWWKRNKDKVKIDPYWIYRSMERNRVYKIAKWTCYLMFIDHGILIDVPTIMGWPNKIRSLTKEDLVIIDSYEEFFEEMFQRVLIIDGIDNPYGVYKTAVDFMTSKGVIEKIDDFNKIYVPNNPYLLVTHITDHIGRIKPEKSQSDKETLDSHSMYMTQLRDMYGVTVIDIAQLNRNIENTYRMVNTDIDVAPQDFKGSGDMYENADVVIGLMNPYKLQAYNYGGYSIRSFIGARNNNRFRALKVIKNSYGVDDFVIGFNFLGEIGLMAEIPKAEEINYEEFKDGRYITEFCEKRKVY